MCVGGVQGVDGELPCKGWGVYIGRWGVSVVGGARQV